ncbi:thiamine diphosphate-binding protein [Mycotypha africana]|uniref:thiamine diphosphate-binding protein n=1 Tax=Mycotypha africana TaxID=64632 RepID=UPI0023015848|nr:thiamine diphosphate-binding protein [Mycotypha africana]KAI8987383.1 thiamine diphosphate-binding protein [Mycotypha africana]
MPNVTISEYLLKRLKELNIDVIFGVPGDYNMPLLDFIEDDKDLTWGANANELNAAYAADGYARIRGAAALVTTFGVGELSAMNGIAGSYSEMVPVIHIVGTPVTTAQDQQSLLHHTLGNGDYQVFSKMASMVTVASTHITAERATSEIDEVIKTAYIKKRPGYLAFPLDLMTQKIDIPEDVFHQPLKLDIPRNPSEVQEIVLDNVIKAIENAKRPTIMVDGCALRQHIQKEVNEFVQKSGFPAFTAPMGKGTLDESLPNFRGCYSGTVSLEGVQKEVEQADLLIEIGSIKSDFNTGNFTYGLDKKKTISLHSFSTTIYHAEYPGVGMVELIPLITARLKETRQFDFPQRAQRIPTDTTTDIITHNYLWNKIADLIPVNSIVVTDTGTSEFGIFDVHGPKGTQFISQILWGSIGYSVGAALGAAMADRSKRVYLFVGDGSYQLTAQEVSVFIRQGITPVIFLINNEGYTIEKMLHGREREYNNIPTWEYSSSLKFFGGHTKQKVAKRKHSPSQVGVEARVTTRKEFEDTMEKVQQQADKIHFVEIVMPEMDIPRQLDKLVENGQK